MNWYFESINCTSQTPAMLPINAAICHVLSISITSITPEQDYHSKAPHSSENPFHKLIKRQLEQLIRHSHSSWMFNRTQRILNHCQLSAPSLFPYKHKLTKLHIKININLMQHIPHVQRLRIRQHHKLDTRRRLIVMQLVLSRPIRNEAIIWTSQLANHIPQREDRSEDELRIVLSRETSWSCACRAEISGPLRDESRGVGGAA